MQIKLKSSLSPLETLLHDEIKSGDYNISTHNMGIQGLLAKKSENKCFPKTIPDYGIWRTVESVLLTPKCECHHNFFEGINMINMIKYRYNQILTPHINNE